jgi:ElaB/YqjD/DUF883 family membrane-anchored ribosome-binding protein
MSANSPSDTRSPDEIRDDIEQAREELGDTAAAIAAKADVKARAKEKLVGAKQSVSEKAPGATGEAAGGVKATVQQHPTAFAAVAGFVGGLVLGRITSRG